VNFALQNLPTSELKIADLTLRAQPVENGTAKFDISMSLREIGDGSVEGSIEYSKDLFEEETIERMAGHFSLLMQGLVSRPDCPISNHALLAKSEEDQLIEYFNRDLNDCWSAPLDVNRNRIAQDHR